MYVPSRIARSLLIHIQAYYDSPIPRSTGDVLTITVVCLSLFLGANGGRKICIRLIFPPASPTIPVWRMRCRIPTTPQEVPSPSMSHTLFLDVSTLNISLLIDIITQGCRIMALPRPQSGQSEIRQRRVRLCTPRRHLRLRLRRRANSGESVRYDDRRGSSSDASRCWHGWRPGRFDGCRPYQGRAVVDLSLFLVVCISSLGRFRIMYCHRYAIFTRANKNWTEQHERLFEPPRGTFYSYYNSSS